MKNLSHFLSFTLLVLVSACSTQISSPPSGEFRFRVVKIEHKTLLDENIPEYTRGLYWITAVAVHPSEHAGKDFRFGCEKMPESGDFLVGHVYRARGDFASFTDWSHRYETIKLFEHHTNAVEDLGPN